MIIVGKRMSKQRAILDEESVWDTENFSRKNVSSMCTVIGSIKNI